MSTVIQLSDFITQVSKARLDKYCGTELVLTPKVSESLDTVWGQEIGMIMLWGSIGAINFKVHFNLDTATRFSAHSLHRKVEEVNATVAREFVREMCNLVAGFLRGFFESNKILIGMSLPFLAKGSDEPIFAKLRDSRAVQTIWSLKSELLGEFICSTEITLLDDSSLSVCKAAMDSEMAVMTGKAAAAVSDGDLEFL